MLLAEAYHTGRFVHVPRDVPYVEVLSCVHDKELAQAVHETGGAPSRLRFILPIVIHRAPVDLDDGSRASIVPHGDGRCVRVMIDAASTGNKHKKRVTRDDGSHQDGSYYGILTLWSRRRNRQEGSLRQTWRGPLEHLVLQLSASSAPLCPFGCT